MKIKFLKKFIDIFKIEYPDACAMNEELAYAEDEKNAGESYYSQTELFDLWIEYLDYYDISFQELSRTFNMEYSFPKWLEENK